MQSLCVWMGLVSTVSVYTILNVQHLQVQVWNAVVVYNIWYNIFNHFALGSGINCSWCAVNHIGVAVYLQLQLTFHLLWVTWRKWIDTEWNLTTNRFILTISNICACVISLLVYLKSVYLIPDKMSCLTDPEFTAGLKSKCLLYFLSRRAEMTRFKCTLKDFGSSATFHTLLSPQKRQKQPINVTTNFRGRDQKVLFSSKKFTLQW